MKQWKKIRKAFWFDNLSFYNCRIAVNLICHDRMGRSRILEMMGKSWRIECFTMKFHFEFLGFETYFLKTSLFWICKHFCDLFSLRLQLFNSILILFYLEVFWIYTDMHKLPLQERRDKTREKRELKNLTFMSECNVLKPKDILWL